VPGATVADAVGAGYALNMPLRVTLGGTGDAPAPVVTVEGRAVRVEAVKLADDRSGDVIVRVYESLGGRAVSRLIPAFPVASVEVNDLLERPLDGDPVAVDADGAIPVGLRPFQVLTLRLRRDRS
jgi:alpha-mannosidase